MKITYLGITCLLFDDGVDQILFDCSFSRPSIRKLLFSKLSSDTKAIDEIFACHKIDRLKAIFISHSHVDHVMDLPYVSSKCNCDVYGSISTKNVALTSNIDENKIHLFEDKLEYNINGFNIKVIPSIHSKAKWYNNDLGEIISEPFKSKPHFRDYKEGNSYDFLITYDNKKYLIRPSFNYIKHQFDDITCDVLFLGIAGGSKATDKELKEFFEETVLKTKPKKIIPIHWDNFFHPLKEGIKGMPFYLENTNKLFNIIEKHLIMYNYSFIILPPQSFIIE